ncbi:shikimate dehydrogenase [bacterium]|nr:shikimate dehydrogenase [bacterium]
MSNLSDNLRGIDGETRVAGVIGWPVRHSLSPPMHNAAFAALGLNWVYVPFAVQPERVGEAMAAVRGLDLAGLNVTIPHKPAVLPYLDELGPEAQTLGVANTIINREGRLTGRNTDGEGFLRSLREIGGDVAGQPVTLIGAGGSARSVALAVCQAGAARLTIVNRTLERAEALAEMLRTIIGAGEASRATEVCAVALEAPEAEAAVSGAGVVIDSTAVGMYPHHDVAPVVPEGWLRPGMIVADLTYNPRQTVLLRAAARQGARTLDGTGMLVHQGALSFEYWTGQPAPVEVMRQALLKRLGEGG